MPEFAKVDIEDHLMIITMNRPEVMNACHPPMSQEMGEIFDEFEENPDLWVAIVTGAGDRAFCAGNDLKYHAEMRAKTGKRPNHGASGFGGITRRVDMVKPVIAAVNGVAMGGGFEIALACDIIIASDKARFALPEPRVGLTAGAGGHAASVSFDTAQARDGDDADGASCAGRGGVRPRFRDGAG